MKTYKVEIEYNDSHWNIKKWDEIVVTYCWFNWSQTICYTDKWAIPLDFIKEFCTYQSEYIAP
jgi:hypothetical protein